MGEESIGGENSRRGIGGLSLEPPRGLHGKGLLTCSEGEQSPGTQGTQASVA